MILEHQVRARRPRALWIIGGVWLVLLAAIVYLDAAWWIIAPAGLLTLPAVIEALRDDQSRLSLDRTSLRWETRRASGEVPLARIRNVRFDTRLDFAINARIVLDDGRSLRLPVECVPPYPRFASALDTAGVRHERHHFGIF